jgi:hypothetical protein
MSLIALNENQILRKTYPDGRMSKEGRATDGERSQFLPLLRAHLLANLAIPFAEPFPLDAKTEILQNYSKEYE